MGCQMQARVPNRGRRQAREGWGSETGVENGKRGSGEGDKGETRPCTLAGFLMSSGVEWAPVINTIPVPSFEHLKFLAHFLFNCYQTW